MKTLPMMTNGWRAASSVVLLTMLSTACAGVQGGSVGARGAEDGTMVLFDGQSTEGWRQIGPGGFTVEAGTLASHGGMGLFYYAERPFRDFVLELEYRVADELTRPMIGHVATAACAERLDAPRLQLLG